MIWTSAALAERLGGDERLARELVDLFLAEYSTWMQAIRLCVERGDAVGIRQSAHTLKGAIANFIEDGPTVTLFALERAGEEARLGDAPALMARLEREVEELVVAMRHPGGWTPCAS